MLTIDPYCHVTVFLLSSLPTRKFLSARFIPLCFPSKNNSAFTNPTLIALPHTSTQKKISYLQNINLRLLVNTFNCKKKERKEIKLIHKKKR